MFTDKKAYILVGLPGTGKSTLVSGLLLQHPDAFVYSTDQFIEDAAAINGWTYNQAFPEFINPATKHMKEQLAIATRSNQTIIWDQTNLSASKRSKIVRTLSDYLCECVCILPPSNATQEEEWQHRLKSRPGKVIPDHVLNNMKQTFEMPTNKEGFSLISYYTLWGGKLNL